LFGGWPAPPPPWRQDCVECCTSCTTESKEPLRSLLLAFALSGWLTARHFCLGLLQKYFFILGWLALRFCYDIIFWKYPYKKANVQKLEEAWLDENVWHRGKRLGFAKSARLSGIQSVNYYVTSVFLRCFRDLIRVHRIENRVPKIREIGSVRVHAGYLIFSFKKTV